jgi:aminoglycoside phosphotransferase (APT) family kinase protein
VRPDDLYDRVRAALHAACASAGVDCSHARLLRLHSNAVFHLPAHDLIARVSTGELHQRIATSLTVTAWLADQGFPTIRPVLCTPVPASGFVVSVWQYVETSEAPRTAADLARLLRRLHALPPPPFDLPEMPSALAGTLDAARAHPEAFADGDQQWLIDRIAQLEAAWTRLRFALPRGLVHGDAHPNNLLPTAEVVLLGDWDHTGRGPREWDLVQPHYFHRRFTTTRADVDRAAEDYGWDIRTWPGLDTLISVREISGLGSYVRTAAVKPASKHELAFRIATLRAGDISAAWHSPQTM